MLYHNIHGYVLARGLDPAVGLFHETRSGHQALVSDLLEEFRALVVDALVLNVANRGAFEEGDFYLAPGTPQPCLMKDEARHRFIEAFEDKLAELLHHPDVEHEVDWRRVLDLQTLRFRRFVQGAVDAYVPFARK